MNLSDSLKVQTDFATSTKEIEQEKPMHDFQGLKKLLTKKGYHIGKAKPWRKIDSEEVSLKEGKLEFESNGIYLIDDDGTKRQVFLYKRKYRLYEYGKPRFHICKCSVIDKFLEGGDIPEYRRANTGTVKVINWDNNDIEEEVSDLPLCKNCASILKNNTTAENSTEFAKILRNAQYAETDNMGNLEVNPISGYTKDWPEISSNYRKSHNYTCEKCGVTVTQFESEFMHVHHKNKNKTDNRKSNLQCLCIKCHSEVDAIHIKNFSTPGQRLLIKLFLEKYRK